MIQTNSFTRYVNGGLLAGRFFASVVAARSLQSASQPGTGPEPVTNCA